MLSVGAPPSPAALPHLIRRQRPSPCILLPFGSRVAATVSIPRPGRRRLIPLTALRRGHRSRKLGEGDEDAGWSQVSDEDDEDEDVDESTLPFQEMRQWLRNKPSGFGEGKNYDTRLEDDLWEEIERSRKTQIENLNKLKNKPNMSDDRPKTKEKAPHKADEAEPGTRVRIWNLPRKKNIHRDLHHAFRGFPGLVSISPAVIGNEKTREPVCRGFAFVCLASKEAANRFVQAYSRKTLCFGKVEKQIACAVINTRGIRDSSEPQEDVSVRFSLSKSLKGGIGLSGASDVDIVSQDSEGRTIEDGSVCIGITEKSDVEDMLSKRTCDGTSTNFEDKENSPGHVTIPVLGCLEHGNEVPWNDLAQKESMPQIRKQRVRTSSSKKATKTDLVQGNKPSLLGSMARLKIKERTVLTGVFSKYSRNVASET
ncbi:uncharacterized protein LOC122025655 isoform X2 [Zingiber officinale]|uniref:uncharacterized protein LOC122025655 isoform X2 n=1 Tax=Zingiber officinale TaxID=94328 RepID=UPI001C4CCCDF|nr:uncharacterized protein LOC122025655 isoform X2 [Zingiber officinale]